MYHTTGFTKDQVDELCAQVHAANEVTAELEKVTWPPILGLFKSVVVTLTFTELFCPPELGRDLGRGHELVS